MKVGRTITVREFMPEDFESMLTMFQNLSKETLEFGLPPYDRARLERWVSGLSGGVLLLAFEDSKVVGVAMVFGRVSSRLKGVGEFVIYILQGYQNQGLGTSMTTMILQEAKRKGFHRIGLKVVAENVAAVKVYEKAGFMLEGRERGAFLGDDGVYHGQLIMGIIL